MNIEQSKYFYDYEAEDFAEILNLSDKFIEFRFMHYDRTFCFTLEHFTELNKTYNLPAKFLTEKEYLFERLKHG